LPNAANFDKYPFAGDKGKKVTVKQCPDKSSTLTQMMEVTVSKKGNQNLDADQVRVCACRNFLKDGVQHIYGFLNPLLAAGILVPGLTVVDHTVPTEPDFGMVCKQAAAKNNWTHVVWTMNEPTLIVPKLKAANITGQEHCAKSWIIEGACAEIVKETSLLQHKLSTEDKIDAAIHRHEQSVGHRILAAVANASGDTICVEATVGDIAPVPGSFTATTGQQAVEVAAGTVADENGSFCVAKATVLLLQRTHSLHTANDIESALTTKDSTTARRQRLWRLRLQMFHQTQKTSPLSTLQETHRRR